MNELGETKSDSWLIAIAIVIFISTVLVILGE